MAHFAEIDENNVVLRIVVIDNSNEDQGEEYCQQLTGSTNRWLKTSYNTVNGEHRLGGTPFRKHYAVVGFTYDAVRDAFVPPQPYPSWILNEDTCTWEAPVTRPELEWGTVGLSTHWDEKNGCWKILQDIPASQMKPGDMMVINEETVEWMILPAPTEWIPIDPPAPPEEIKPESFPPILPTE